MNPFLSSSFPFFHIYTLCQPYVYHGRMDKGKLRRGSQRKYNYCELCPMKLIICVFVYMYCTKINLSFYILDIKFIMNIRFIYLRY